MVLFPTLFWYLKKKMFQIWFLADGSTNEKTGRSLGGLDVSVFWSTRIEAETESGGFDVANFENRSQSKPMAIKMAYPKPRTTKAAATKSG